MVFTKSFTKLSDICKSSKVNWIPGHRFKTFDLRSVPTIDSESSADSLNLYDILWSQKSTDRYWNSSDELFDNFESDIKPDISPEIVSNSYIDSDLVPDMSIHLTMNSNIGITNKLMANDSDSDSQPLVIEEDTDNSRQICISNSSRTTDSDQSWGQLYNIAVKKEPKEQNKEKRPRGRPRIDPLLKEFNKKMSQQKAAQKYRTKLKKRLNDYKIEERQLVRQNYLLRSNLLDLFIQCQSIIEQVKQIGSKLTKSQIRQLNKVQKLSSKPIALCFPKT